MTREVGTPIERFLNGARRPAGERQAKTWFSWQYLGRCPRLVLVPLYILLQNP